MAAWVCDSERAHALNVLRLRVLAVLYSMASLRSLLLVTIDFDLVSAQP